MVTASKMENAFVKEETSDSDDKRPNLLGIIEDRNRSLNKVFRLLRSSCIMNVLVVIRLYC